MEPPSQDADRLGRAFAHERTVFVVCATMVGVCLTAIGLIRVVELSGAIRALSRGVLAVDALVFLVGALFSFAALRLLVRGRDSWLLSAADAAMLLGLVGIVVVCFTLVFSMA
jgi:hypothetical protein